MVLTHIYSQGRGDPPPAALCTDSALPWHRLLLVSTTQDAQPGPGGQVLMPQENFWLCQIHFGQLRFLLQGLFPIIWSFYVLFCLKKKNHTTLLFRVMPSSEVILMPFRSLLVILTDSCLPLSYEQFWTNVLTAFLWNPATQPICASAPTLAADVIQAICHG